VVALEGPSLQAWRLLNVAGLRTVRVDLRDAEAVARTVREVGPSVVLNCAAYGAYSQQANAKQTYEVNVDGVRHLLEALRAVRHLRAFVQASSSSEYGTNCSGPLEDGPTWPDSHYAVSKVAATALVRFYAGKFGLPAFSLRLYSVYGPFEDGSRLIPRLLGAAREGRLPPLVSPSISRDFIFVDDAAAAFARVVERAPKLRKGDVFNIGAGKKVTLRQLVALTRKTFRVAAKPVWGSMENRSWDHPGWYANPRKAARVLGWSSATPLAEGLRRTLQWMEKNPDLSSQAERFSVARLSA
jgi:dolichol-phosphate mannosyltransferase